jgi:hypothetical protein
MMAKKIPVGDGYEVEFLQRARGEETPYWRGQVLKDGKVVGHFSNDGRGGATHIDPPDIVAAFRKLVDEAAPEVDHASLLERDAIVLSYAEFKGYYKRAAHMTLADVVREFAKDPPSGH